MWNKHSEEIQLILEPKAKGLITASNLPSGSGPFYLSELVSYPSPACFLSSCPYWSPHCPLSVSSIYLLHLLSESLFLQIASCFSPLVPSGLVQIIILARLFLIIPSKIVAPWPPHHYVLSSLLCYNSLHSPYDIYFVCLMSYSSHKNRNSKGAGTMLCCDTNTRWKIPDAIGNH